MNKKWIAQMKATSIMLRIYGYVLLAFIVASLIPNMIFYFWTDLSMDDTNGVSIFNMALIFLLIMAILIPTASFTKMINLGASRQEYYTGTIFIYAVWSLGLSLLNVLGLAFENHIWSRLYSTLNILHVFRWDEFGYLGSILYQFVVYMMVASFFHFLFSGIRFVAGWLIWAILIAALPLLLSFSVSRSYTGEFFHHLLFNSSLWQGMVWNLLLTLLFLFGGWMFTRRRKVL